MSEAVRLKTADQMSPYEALLRSFGYNERFTPEDLAEVRTCLERAVQQAPGNAECWAMLSLMYANEYGHWDNAGPDSLDRALRAARTAVEAAPLHSLPYYALAQALFFQREFPAFRVAAERAVSLNPMDGATAAFMGLLIAYAGDWERGCALSEKGAATESQPSGMVPLHRLARRLPQEGLPQPRWTWRSISTPRELLHPCGVGHVLRATWRAWRRRARRFGTCSR